MLTVHEQRGQTWVEQPRFFPATDPQLFGIVSMPVGPTKDLAVVLAWGNGQKPSWGSNRMRAHLARSLAAAGYPCLRFDYRGVGDSGGRFAFTLVDPPVADVRAACELVSKEGHVNRVALVGYCAGGRAALAAASELPLVAGAMVVSSPILDTVHGDYRAATLSRSEIAERISPRSLVLLITDSQRRRWAVRVVEQKARATLRRTMSAGPWGRREPHASAAVIEPLRHLAERNVSIALVYGTEDDFYLDFTRARDIGALGPLLRAERSTVSARSVPGRLHGFSTLGIQQTFRAEVERWIDSLCSDSPPPRRGG